MSHKSDDTEIIKQEIKVEAETATSEVERPLTPIKEKPELSRKQLLIQKLRAMAKQHRNKQRVKKRRQNVTRMLRGQGSDSKLPTVKDV